MTNVRQKRKNRSGLPKAKAKRTGLLKNGRKKINVLGNAIIAENWYEPTTYPRDGGFLPRCRSILQPPTCAAKHTQLTRDVFS